MIEELKVKNLSMEQKNKILESTINHYENTAAKPIKASDLGRLRVRIEIKDE